MTEERAKKGAPKRKRGPYRPSVVAKNSPRLGALPETAVSARETTLTPRNRKLAALIASGMPVVKASEECGIKPPSGYRLLRDPVIKAEIARIRDDAAEEVRVYLGSKAMEFAETLVTVAKGGHEGHKDMPRLKAAQLGLAMCGITPESLARTPSDPVYDMTDEELEADVLAFADKVRGLPPS